MASPAEPFASARLRLAPLAAEAGDLALYRALYCDPGVMRHIAPPVDAAAIAGRHAAACRDSQAQPLPNRWSLRLPGGDAVGLAGCFLAPATRQAELGVMLLPAAQRQGLAGEALHALMARLVSLGGVDHAWSRHAPAHRAMARVLEGCGFARGGLAGPLWRWQRALPGVAPVIAPG